MMAILVIALILFAWQHNRKVNRYRQRLEIEELRKRHSVFEALQQGEENERKRLAEELHDGVGAKLAGIKMKLEYLRVHYPQEPVVNEVYQGMEECIMELRQISHNLQPSYIAQNSLCVCITEYVRLLNDWAECRFHIYCSPDEPLEIPVTVKLHAYRILLELLHNIYKHSGATRADVQLMLDSQKLQLMVEDNGRGYVEETNSKGIGLANIRNRVAFCNGHIHIDSNANGTSIIIELPLTSRSWKT